jgi:hypothetical protein
MTSDMYLGKGTLYGFKRGSLCHIYLTDNIEDYVVGDIWDVTPELENNLYTFEERFGYRRAKCIVLDESGKFNKCIVYLVD